jgi:hypothetical protein
MLNKHFKTAGALAPGRSSFDLSHTKLLTMDAGQLVPAMCIDCMPGDIFNFSNEIVVRAQPMLAPILHQVDVSHHLFFVPYRSLWSSWEVFITGDEDGDDDTSLPQWDPTDYSEGSLWDLFGFPPVEVDGFYPVYFPLYAYNKIYNEWYRDQNLISAVALTQEDILYRGWERDYFTGSLPWQQRGTAPALPLTGTGFADFTNAIGYNNAGEPVAADDTNNTLFAGVEGAGNTELLAALNKNEIDFSDIGTIDMADLRFMAQVQKYMERSARGGSRYTENLRMHYGVAPRDERLDRPEYIGGSKGAMITSEVLQTESSDASTPQGTMVGHGMHVGRKYIGSYRVKEHGCIMAILSIMPKPMYHQGIDRQWLKSDKFDYPWPEFAHLSEQAVVVGELYANDSAVSNNTVFGYIGRYDEYRYQKSTVCTGMRADFDFWHMCRQFGSAPTLNGTFVTCNPRKDMFAVPAEDSYIVYIGNIVKALRPIPAIANPGMIDY